jgi:DNA (cytosine-5)-methyltransferase 3A
MNVLSLFDGISCGQIALNRVGIKYDNYYASEIDKYAIKVTQHNYPNTIQLGDITQINGSDLPKIDLLIGGSPCQSFSSVGNGSGFDGKSGLFWEFVRILNEIKPKYFLLENVVMKKEWKNIITKEMGINPFEICSSLFSAQKRKRLYWTNIPFDNDIKDAGILLDDIIDHSLEEYKIPKSWEIYVPTHLPKYCDPYNKKEIKDKSTTLRTNCYNGNMWIKTKEAYRNLTRRETELLQTLPIGYTEIISENQAKKCLGNGWTIDVIAHIFKNIKL